MICWIILDLFKIKLISVKNMASNSSLIVKLFKFIYYITRLSMFIVAFVLFGHYLVEFARFLQRQDKKVVDLIYWRDVKRSGIVFGVTLLVLLAFSYFSIISVLAYSGLLLLTATVNFRIYKAVTAAVQKTDPGNPFKDYLSKDCNIPKEKMHEQVETWTKHGHEMLLHLRRLFLVEDVVDSLKFGVTLWSLTYIGKWFSGIALLILGLIAVFTVPKFYETYQTQIDHYYNLVRSHVTQAMNQVREKVPFLKEKKQ